MELVEARALVQDKTAKDITARHLGVMRALARRFGEDEHRWALAGLFHDLDQDQTGEDSDRHAYLAAEWLREARGVEEPVIKKKLKERSFAPGVNRVEVYGAERPWASRWRSSSPWPSKASSRSHRKSACRIHAIVRRPVRCLT